VRRQPGAVLGEVRADRSDQQRPEPEAAQAERDVRGHAATADLEVVHQERQRDLVQFVRHQLLGKAAGKAHQVVGGDRAGHSNAHDRSPVGEDSGEGG
jgi:hypothetical protein